MLDLLALLCKIRAEQAETKVMLSKYCSGRRLWDQGKNNKKLWA